MYALPIVLAPVGFVFLAASVALAFVPMRGLPLVDWIRLAVAHQIDRAARTGTLAPHGATGCRESRVRVPVPTPESWGRLRIVAAPYANGAVGVLMDAARQTASATMIVRTESFALLADADQERRVAAWGGVLSGLAREAGSVRRISWTERTVPAEVDELAGVLRRPSATAPCRSTAPRCSPTSS